MRAFAIIFVLMGHWGMPFSTKNPVGGFIKQYIIPDGTFGVDLFFVLSGFLITSILLHVKDANEHDSQFKGIKTFFIRRILRIFPIYYLTIFFLLIINYSEVREHAWYYLTFTSNILLYQTNSWGFIPHTWSLAVEEQFYLLWPWLILYVNKKYLKYVFALAILTGIVSSYIVSDVLHKGEFPILVFNCMGCFGLGGLYAYSRYTGTPYRKFEQWLLPAFVISVIMYFRWKFVHDAFWAHTTFLFRIVEGIISVQIITAVVNNKSARIRKNILENRYLNFIGVISYGIYLYHNILQPIYDGYIERARLRHPGMPWIIYNYYFSYCAKLFLIFVISWLSYKLIEKPLLGLKKRFEYKDQ